MTKLNKKSNITKPTEIPVSNQDNNLEELEDLDLDLDLLTDSEDEDKKLTKKDSLNNNLMDRMISDINIRKNINK